VYRIRLVSKQKINEIKINDDDDDDDDKSVFKHEFIKSCVTGLYW